MRTFLISSAAWLGLALAGAAAAQTPPAPDASGASMAPPPAMAPAPAPDASAPPAPADQSAPAAPAAPAPEAAAPPPAPMHHRLHRVAQPGGAAYGDGGEHWAHEPGTGQSGPASGKASNITAGDTHSAIAPHFQTPAVGDNAGPEGYLRAAQHALAAHKTGEAQQALEMAETRLLTRSMPVSQSGQPSADPMVSNVSRARQALGQGDVSGAAAAIKAALGG